MICDWCGHEHDLTALCAQRPTWGRRGFLALMGAAAVGAMLPDVAPSGTWRWVITEPLRREGDSLLWVARWVNLETRVEYSAPMTIAEAQKDSRYWNGRHALLVAAGRRGVTVRELAGPV